MVEMVFLKVFANKSNSNKHKKNEFILFYFHTIDVGTEITR